MKVKLLLIVVCLLATSLLKSQNLEWVKTFGGNESDYGISMYVDDEGNVYTTGSYSGTVDFDPGEGVTNLTAVDLIDVFVQKLDASGNLLWAKSFGGTFAEQGLGISVDGDGNVYTTGHFNGTADFDPSEEIFEITSSGSNDIFVQKLDANGNFVWANAYGNPFPIFVLAICSDADGNVFTTGRFQGIVDFDPSEGKMEIESNGSWDTFVQKLDTDGNFVWAKTFGGSTFEIGYSIAADADGNVYTTGVFDNTTDLDPSEEVSSFTSIGLYDSYIQKLDEDGNFIWAKTFGGISSDVATYIQLDANGNIIIAGRYDGTADFDPTDGIFNLTAVGSVDAFVMKLDSDGEFVWANSIGGGSFDQSTAVNVDNNGHVYTTGTFNETVDFDPSDGTSNLTSKGGEDVFVQKLDAGGNFVWVIAFGGETADNSRAIGLDDSDNVYTSGYFDGTTDFDPSEATLEVTSNGLTDVFIQKIRQSTTGIIEVANGVSVTAYPNPSEGIVHITFEKPLDNIEIIMTDLLGNEVFSKKYDRVANEDLQINGASGTYYLKVITPESQSVVKIVKK